MSTICNTPDSPCFISGRARITSLVVWGLNRALAPLPLYFPSLPLSRKRATSAPALAFMASVRKFPVSMSVKSVVASPMTVQAFGGGGFLFW